MTGRIFITGDKHGAFMPLFGLVENNDIKDTDILIIAGDAGYVWNQDYHSKAETVRQIFPGTVAFVDGNHENHALLGGMEVVTWNGGRAHRVGENLYHLMRGEIYSIDGVNIFTFGGACSSDKDRRTEGESWWREEVPDEEEISYGRQQLMKNLDEIDYVITHETPRFAREPIARKKPVDEGYMLWAHLEDWYQMISEGKRFKKWYFGHMHVDQEITPKLRALHNDILTIGEEKRIKWA